MKKTIPNLTKKNLGAFYTPTHTVDWMVSLLPKPRPEDSYLEPSGGDGAFVRGILRVGVGPSQIEVWDINQETQGFIEELGVSFLCQDSLLDTDFRSGQKKLVTRIVGNPPYLAKASSYIKKNKDLLRKRFPEISAAETYGMFLFLSGSSLAPGGELVFIISDTYRTLKTHEKLRRWLLSNFTISQIALMPKGLFKETGTTVATSIIHLKRKRPDKSSLVTFNDCRELEPGNYQGIISTIAQEAISALPGAVMNSANPLGKDIAKHFKNKPGKLLDLLDGGIGMHTLSNATHLAKIQRGQKGPASKRVPNTIAANLVGAGKDWRVYHKSGGEIRYWAEPSTAIKWDATSRKEYMYPKPFSAIFNDTLSPILISGVSAVLAARLGEIGSPWNSNKCFGFKSKNPKKYPSEFFIGVLNTDFYNTLLKYVNHTASVQLSDLRELPLLKFTQAEVKKISTLTKALISKSQNGVTVDKDIQREQIEDIVVRAAER